MAEISLGVGSCNPPRPWGWARGSGAGRAWPGSPRPRRPRWPSGPTRSGSGPRSSRSSGGSRRPLATRRWRRPSPTSRPGCRIATCSPGLFLAGIRNVKPRPVGFKFHAVLVINSAHLLGQTAAPDERLLPLLWALDNFKNSQAQDVSEGDWTLGKVDEAKVPGPTSARAAFVKAMEAWDSDAADVAAAGLCRASGAAEVMEPFWRYAVRDQRDIGHKAIFAAQCWRTLQAIGWQHAEPVLRVARLRDARPPGRRPARRRRPLRRQPRAGQEDPRRLAGRQGRPRRDRRAARGDPPGHARRGLGRGRPGCSTAGPRPARSGTRWSWAARSC